MGRGRAKGKKLTASNQEDPGSVEEEKIPAQKRRGRPQKPLKDETDEDEIQKIEDGDSKDTTGALTKDSKSLIGLQNGKKQKRNSQEKIDLAKEEHSNGTKLSTGELSIPNGVRPYRNRRKSKPRRAAEAVVECN